MNKLMKLDIGGHELSKEHYVEIYNDKIKQIGGIDDFIISKSVVDGIEVAVAEITDYYLILTLHPVQFVEKLSKSDLKNKLGNAVNLNKFKSIVGVWKKSK